MNNEQEATLHVKFDELLGNVARIVNFLERVWSPKMFDAQSVPINKGGQCDGSTFCWFDCGGPNGTHAWEVRNLAIGGGDAFTTLAGVAAAVYITTGKQAPPNGNANTLGTQDLRIPGSGIPNGLLLDRFQMTVPPNGRLLVCVKGAASGQTITLSGEVTERDVSNDRVKARSATEKAWRA